MTILLGWAKIANYLTFEEGSLFMPHILIVCTANICRSPVGEALLQEKLRSNGYEGWTVASAGTWAQDGRRAAEFSQLLMSERELDISGHRSRNITTEILADADLVLCMESGHAEALRAEFPAQASKIYLLTEMRGRKYSINDPYGGPLETYQQMVQELSEVIEAGFPRIVELGQKPTNHRA
ncbi:MAG: low molecular weight protein arginine phosphatase [Chloroflexi bacterium]|nr:low molecular weight protein arginine phosphatase [Chloroflexota bacterium]MBP8058397.1 low molecular weight protein arginine phosphatase [Chloroflexota bacterium]